ncbi:MAG TPA: nucleoside recognition domain-containing protein, partial [Rubrobacteraceae bacterium]|nr:nucleoside recognition domain-containing protein [Rubrobacteraceae bacterium]
MLQYTAIYETLLSGLTPVMALIGLPKESAIPLTLGNLLNLYAAIGAMLTMDLTVKQVFVLALMLGFSHGLPLEAAICRKIGVSVLLVVSFRITLALAAAFAVNALWSGGGEIARYGFVPAAEAEPSGWMEILLAGLQAAISGIVQLAVIVIPVMLMIRILKDIGVLERFAQLMRPLMRPLGIAPRGAVTMAGGLIFGLAFGAGVIIEQVREQKFTRRELTLMILFLCVCHAVIEDTLIFIPLGINVLPLLLIRLTAAILLTLLIARLWRSDSP